LIKQGNIFSVCKSEGGVTVQNMKALKDFTKDDVWKEFNAEIPMGKARFMKSTVSRFITFLINNGYAENILLNTFYIEN